MTNSTWVLRDANNVEKASVNITADTDEADALQGWLTGQGWTKLSTITTSTFLTGDKT